MLPTKFSRKRIVLIDLTKNCQVFWYGINSIRLHSSKLIRCSNTKKKNDVFISPFEMISNSSMCLTNAYDAIHSFNIDKISILRM